MELQSVFDLNTDWFFIVSLTRKFKKWRLECWLPRCSFFAYLLGKIVKGPTVTVPQTMISETIKMLIAFWWDICSEMTGLRSSWNWLGANEHTFRDQTSWIYLVVPHGRTFVTGALTALTDIIRPIHIFPSDEESIQNYIHRPAIWLAIIYSMCYSHCCDIWFKDL